MHFEHFSWVMKCSLLVNFGEYVFQLISFFAAHSQHEEKCHCPGLQKKQIFVVISYLFNMLLQSYVFLIMFILLYLCLERLSVMKANCYSDLYSDNVIFLAKPQKVT